MSATARCLAGLAFFFGFGAMAFILRASATEPTNVESLIDRDSFKITARSMVGERAKLTFSGDVRIFTGDLVARADRLEAKLLDGRIESLDAFGSVCARAGEREAFGAQASYRRGAAVITIHGNARLIEGDSVALADTIRYDMNRSNLTMEPDESAPRSSPERSGSEEVKTGGELRETPPRPARSRPTIKIDPALLKQIRERERASAARRK